ncbi:hypothetical protein B0H19DRAFT_1058339 [Mycena capillaripes]|nr:hypothetical protein B0H19DRAFT_1058339 [Mycena capillaripes]
MAGTSPPKRKSTGPGCGPSSTKKQRGTAGKGKAPEAGGAAGTSSTGGGAAAPAGAASGAKDDDGDKEGGALRRNPHGIAPNDIDEAAKPTQRAFQRHIRMAAGLLTADTFLEPADTYIDHYDKRFNDVDDMEGLMRQIVTESKKPNKDAQKRAERLIRDAKVIMKGEGAEPGYFGQIAKDISLMPAEHIAFFFAAVTRAGLKAFHPDVFGPTHSTYNLLHRHLAVSTFQTIAGWYGYTALNVSLTVTQDYHLLSDFYDNFMYGTVRSNSCKEHNSPGSLSKSLVHSSADKHRTQLADRRYKEAKSKGYRKPVLRLLKVKATHSDDERPPGGNARKKKGLHICTKDGRNPAITAFVRELDGAILKQIERNPNRNLKCVSQQTRTVTVPPTPSSTLSRILPVGVPIDFWDPQFYNNDLDIREKAMYVGTGVAFPLAQLCTNEHVDKWAKLPAKEFMAKFGKDVLAQYKLPTPEEIAALGLDNDSDEDNEGDDESTELEDTDEDEEME